MSAALSAVRAVGEDGAFRLGLQFVEYSGELVSTAVVDYDDVFKAGVDKLLYQRQELVIRHICRYDDAYAVNS